MDILSNLKSLSVERYIMLFFWATQYHYIT